MLLLYKVHTWYGHGHKSQSCDMMEDCRKIKNNGIKIYIYSMLTSWYTYG